MPNFRSVEVCQEIVANDLEKIPDEYKNFDDKTRNNRSVNPWKKMIVGILSCKRTHNRLVNWLTIYDDIFKILGLEYYIIYADPSMVKIARFCHFWKETDIPI